jgi:hypothetical protein
MVDIRLERTRSKMPTWKKYKEIRARHYVPDHGSQGRQLHYLIYGDAQIVGIISGGSSTFSVKAVDEFFGLDMAKRFDIWTGEAADKTGFRPDLLGTVINNTVFRLEYHEHKLASRVLKMWRERITADWENSYGITNVESMFDTTLMLPGVMGFETFIVPNEHRTGACYQADRWKEVGKTATGKLIFCKRNPEFLKQLRAQLKERLEGECLMPWSVVEFLEELAGA